jgi:surface polysaccharide O-acyltransferase-like enzyme
MNGVYIGDPRKNFIDNIRSITVILVIIYHVVYLFNSAGVPKNIGETGIPAFDGLCYFIYPWLMAIMFLLAGISARYALQKRTGRQFLKERVQKLLIPVVGGMFLLGWLNGWVTYQYVDIFGGNNTPIFIKYLVFCLMIGPLWFNIELFIVSMVLLLIRKLDKKNNLEMLAEKANILVVFLLVIPFWGSSFLLNTPLVTTFRNGIYLFVFLTGYYIFSQDKIIASLEKFRFLLLTVGTILGIVEIYYFYGQNYADDKCLTHLLTNIYAWVMMMAILGCVKKHFNETNKLMDYLKNRSFFWYLCHYPLMAFIAYILVSFFKLPMIYNYILLLVFSFLATIVFCEIIRLLPVLRYLLFGIKIKTKKL